MAVTRKVRGSVLTDTKVGALRAKPVTYIVWDREMRGFGLRVTANGVKSWVLDYTSGAGTRHRMTLGLFPDELHADAARDRAATLRAKIRSGNDPLVKQEADRLAISGAPTMRELADDWLQNHAAINKREASQALDKIALEKHALPALGELTKVADVTWAQVEAMHRKIVRKGSPVMANRVVTLLAAMFKRAIKKGWRKSDDGNPAAGIQRVREESRERFLNLEEMNRLQAALATSRNKRSAQAVMLLIATGARRGEVLGATWSQFDLAAGVWSKPSSHTKQKRTHVVPLNAIALGVLREMRAGRKEDSPYLFPSEGAKPQQDLKKLWSRVRIKAGIPDVRLHDLRHTFASYAVARGLPLYSVGKLLGHSNAATTARYSHLDLSALREATDTVGGMLAGTSPAVT